MTFLFQTIHGDKAEGRRVDAVPQTGRCRAVCKEMTQMGIGKFAAHLGSNRKEAPVFLFYNTLRMQGLCETGPARTGDKLVRRAKQSFSADHINIDSLGLIVPVLIAKGSFGRILLGNLILKLGQSGL